ncbi:U2 snRNP-associated SURP motif-containing protein-like [Oncorhynchus kisutch]|uniref:U2 snRNP-associated SURP motif-containing protein-like n=1 Tax=Oncorhynchus kisutch TaxID=8019 RepID=UPI0012DD610E|nr:U2 snRNP-associated SURP motif-containing protein-like [Oncorhynchus kisutch]
MMNNTDELSYFLSGIIEQQQPLDSILDDDQPLDGIPDDDQPLDGIPDDDQPLDGIPDDDQPLDGIPDDDHLDSSDEELITNGAVKKWNIKATGHDISRAVGDHLKPLVEPGVVFTTPPRLQQA